MIVVRNVFQLKFGKAKEALELMKEGVAISSRLGHTKATRVLTDVSGPFYTLVFEMTFPSLAELEKGSHAVTSDAGWKAWYAKMVPLVKSGHREIFTIVE